MTGIFIGLNLALLALPALIIKAIGVIGSLSGAIVGLLLSPVGLGMLAGAGLLFGMKGIYDLTRNAVTGGKAFTQEHDELNERLANAGMDSKGRIGYTNKRGRFIKTGERTEEQDRLFQEVQAERENLDNTRDAMRDEIKSAIANAEPDSYTMKRVGKKRVRVPVVSQKKKREIKKRIEAKYINRLDGNNISSITGDRNLQLNNSNDVEVVINNENVTERGSESLKDGDSSDVPVYASSNVDNFYSTYSQLQYGVVV